MLAFGDSITNGGGELQWGVALQSWALWVARSLGMPFTGCAVDGARVSDVVREQIPAFQRLAADPAARYELGCLYIGVNDVRAVDWDARAFHQAFSAALSFLAGRCKRMLTVTAPLDLGRPRAGAKVGELNTTIAVAANEVGALVVDLSGFRGRNLVMTDHVHPTALGQIAIAEGALSVLADDGLPPRVSPRSMIDFETSRWDRLRGDTTYLYRHTKVSVWAAVQVAKLKLLTVKRPAQPPPSARCRATRRRRGRARSAASRQPL